MILIDLKGMKKPLGSADTLSQIGKSFPYLIVFLLSYSTADLSIQKYRPSMLPSEAPPSRPAKSQKQKSNSKDSYESILSKNMFNLDGKIPPALSDDDNQKEQTVEGPAVASNLPLKLMGTIVHVDQTKSVATVDVKSKGQTLPYKVGQDIENIAKMIKIERRKIVFRNLNNNRKEFIEIPRDFKMNFGVSAIKPTNALDGINKVGKYDRSIKKSIVDKFTSPDALPKLLKQARMKPNLGSDGSVQGFKFDWIQPGSPFEDLGFKVGDIIRGVNGEEINSPRKAMEAYNTLKSNPNISLKVMRDGREEDFNYSVR